MTSRAATVNARKAIKVERSVTIATPRAELYAFWRNFENLPRFMEHLVSVRVDSPTRSHWIAKAPAGKTVEWDAEIVNEVQDEIIAWKSVGEPDVANAGAVNFSDAPGGRGTIVRVTLDYEPPAGGSARCARPPLRGARPPDPRGPAEVQAADGDRRDHHVGETRRGSGVRRLHPAEVSERR